MLCNIWGTRFKIRGLSPELPEELGHIIYKSSVLHLQPRQLTVHLTSLIQPDNQAINPSKANRKCFPSAHAQQVDVLMEIQAALKNQSDCKCRQPLHCDYRQSSHSDCQQASNCDRQQASNSDCQQASNCDCQQASNSECQQASNCDCQQLSNSECQQPSNCEHRNALDCNCQTASNLEWRQSLDYNKGVHATAKCSSSSSHVSNGMQQQQQSDHSGYTSRKKNEPLKHKASAALLQSRSLSAPSSPKHAARNQAAGGTGGVYSSLKYMMLSPLLQRKRSPHTRKEAYHQSVEQCARRNCTSQRQKHSNATPDIQIKQRNKSDQNDDNDDDDDDDDEHHEVDDDIIPHWEIPKNAIRAQPLNQHLTKKQCQEAQEPQQQQQKQKFIMHNKEPVWNENSQVYQLDFGGRVTQESAKNLQIEFDGKQVMQFGRIEGNAYTLDFQSPFTAVQAFSIALANVTQRLK